VGARLHNGVAKGYMWRRKGSTTEGRLVKVKMEVECTPAEARAFMGLPDVTPVNEHLVQEMKRRLDENMTRLQPRNSCGAG
jgi:hypothetical protein